jgi:hypothetical protein
MLESRDWGGYQTTATDPGHSDPRPSRMRRVSGGISAAGGFVLPREACRRFSDKINPAPFSHLEEEWLLEPAQEDSGCLEEAGARRVRLSTPGRNRSGCSLGARPFGHCCIRPRNVHYNYLETCTGFGWNDLLEGQAQLTGSVRAVNA